jgi:hypothetical protein
VLPALLLTSHGALQFMAYEYLKTTCIPRDSQPNTLLYSLLGGASKIVAGLATYPTQVCVRVCVCMCRSGLRAFIHPAVHTAALYMMDGPGLCRLSKPACSSGRVWGGRGGCTLGSGTAFGRCVGVHGPVHV